MRYRSDIDGLRAVAVLPVVLYHIQLGSFSGGFVGVDVFFVISGYLITGIVAHEVESGRFSLARFYERRIRRIFPALFFMLAVVFILGWIIMPPDAFKDLGTSVLYTVPFLSNVRFSEVADYFAAPAEMKLLLHTWSLAVEEQFYLVFPIALYAMHRFVRGRLKLLVAVAGVLSFAASVWAMSSGPAMATAAFYQAPLRAWELLIGASLALGMVPPVRGRALASVLALAGIALLAIAIFAYTDSTPFPGATALLPCVGAALLIHAGPQLAWPSRALGAPPLVFVGQISYSLYLWHWPVLVFWRFKADHLLDWRDGLAMLVVSLLAAYFSWRYIERPFRKAPGSAVAKGGARFGVSRRAIFAGAWVASACFLAVSVATIKTNGFEQRFPAWTYVKAEMELDRSMRASIAMTDCNDPQLERAGVDDGIHTHGDCTIVGETAARPVIVVWGDSHANAWLPAFDAAARELHGRAIIISTAGCPPLLGVQRTDRAAEIEACRDPERIRTIIDFIERQHVNQIYLVARWSLYSAGFIRNGRLESENHFLTEDPATAATQETSIAALLKEMPSTVEALSRIAPVVIVRDVPTLGLGARYLALLPQSEQSRYLPSTEEAGSTDAFIAGLKLPAGVSVYDPRARVCSRRCSYTKEGHLLYVDDNHLSAAGAMVFEPDVEGLIKRSVTVAP
jgi:peptidoglycan/LPS O-acetylase OafA/YrhL